MATDVWIAFLSEHGVISCLHCCVKTPPGAEVLICWIKVFRVIGSLLVFIPQSSVAQETKPLNEVSELD